MLFIDFPCHGRRQTHAIVVLSGNFSVVKECARKSDGTKFAVKCINKNALNPKDRSNLVQEINILKEVSSTFPSRALITGCVIYR